MNNSINDSDVDVDINSIFNRKSSPNSPFLAVSPFFSGQYNLNRPRTPQIDISRPYGRVFQAQDFGGNSETLRTTEQLRIERPNLPSYQNWRVPVADPKEIVNNWTSDLNSQSLKFIHQTIQNRESVYEKVHSADTIVSTGISTNSMIMVNPKSRQESGNFHLKENIETRDEQRYNLTTFYLKTFNMFSNSINSLHPVDELTPEPTKTNNIIKKIKKQIYKPIHTGTKLKHHEKRSKRKITCNCKNSGCIKMYCECFRENGFCGNFCKCKDCKNVENNIDRNLSIINVNRKQADEFAFKISKEELTNQLNNDNRNCRCKKSQCQKKYCECFNDGAFCNAGCCCMDCLNGGSK